MPLYEFTCANCTQHFEQILSFAMTEAPTCPHCRSTETRRLMSMPAIHFKGSGFYKTDSIAGEKTEGDADADGEVGKKEADGADGKGAAKVEASSTDKGESSAPADKSEPKKAKTTDGTRRGKTAAKVE